MITLTPTIIDTSMTLVLALNNSNTIVVGVDILRQQKHEDDTYETLYDAKKLWDITKDCVILLAGRNFSFDKINQFIFDFTETIYDLKITNVDDIAKKFENKIQRVPDATQTDLEFIIAGYTDKKPYAYYMDNKHGFKLAPCLNGYCVAGKQYESRKVITTLSDIKTMNTKELKETAQTILCKVHFECPSEVGGDLRVKKI